MFVCYLLASPDRLISIFWRPLVGITVTLSQSHHMTLVAGDDFFNTGFIIFFSRYCFFFFFFTLRWGSLLIVSFFNLSDILEEKKLELSLYIYFFFLLYFLFCFLTTKMSNTQHIYYFFSLIINTIMSLSYTVPILYTVQKEIICPLFCLLRKLKK